MQYLRTAIGRKRDRLNRSLKRNKKIIRTNHLVRDARPLLLSQGGELQIKSSPPGQEGWPLRTGWWVYRILIKSLKRNKKFIRTNHLVRDARPLLLSQGGELQIKSSPPGQEGWPLRTGRLFGKILNKSLVTNNKGRNATGMKRALYSPLSTVFRGQAPRL